MKRAAVFAILIAAFSVLGSISSAAYAHSGGTDKNGCHNDRKNGTWHCH